MFIENITIQNFGSVEFYGTKLEPKLNLLDNRHTEELAAAIHFLLCRTPSIPEHWLCETTRISAKISLTDGTYTVCAKPVGKGLQMFVTDPAGNDATNCYRHALSHCMEQDDTEIFDGQDKETPLRLYRYGYREENPDLSEKTQRLADTGTFRKHLRQYIHTFRPEPINCKKNYQTAISPDGKFKVTSPGVSGKVFLSETEEKLFLFICFLNIAEFWQGIEKIRDLHHEEKPLLIQKFVEFTDASVDTHNLLARAEKLRRQIIILSTHANHHNLFHKPTEGGLDYA